MGGGGAGGGGGVRERERARLGGIKGEGEYERETGFQARSKDQEILEGGGGAGPSLLPRRDHE